LTPAEIVETADCIGDGLGLAGRAADQFLAAGCSMAEMLEIMRAKMLIRALEACEGNLMATSRKLRQHRNTTARELERLQLKTLPAQLRKSRRSRAVQVPLAFASGKVIVLDRGIS
jgi:DNA-binding NtrC family response regulator